MPAAPQDIVTFDDLRPHLSSAAFRYLDLARAEIRHSIQVGMNRFVHVIGQSGHGVYEWIVCGESANGDVIVTHSNFGYGGAATALRDGLNRVLDDA